MFLVVVVLFFLGKMMHIDVSGCRRFVVFLEKRMHIDVSGCRRFVFWRKGCTIDVSGCRRFVFFWRA
jgi:hypothetical protein